MKLRYIWILYLVLIIPRIVVHNFNLNIQLSYTLSDISRITLLLAVGFSIYTAIRYIIRKGKAKHTQ